MDSINLIEQHDIVKILTVCSADPELHHNSKFVLTQNSLTIYEYQIDTIENQTVAGLEAIYVTFNIRHGIVRC